MVLWLENRQLCLIDEAALFRVTVSFLEPLAKLYNCLLELLWL
jgi:hypothetical protein